MFWIALGLFLALSLYFIESSVLGMAISEFMFGFMGILSYIIPIVFIIFGVLCIMNSAKRLAGRTTVLIILLLTAIATLINVSIFSITDTGLIDYYSRAYVDCSNGHSGGGLLGALLAYPLTLLIGKTGAIIMLTAAIIIIIMFLTHLSLSRIAISVKRHARNAKTRHREHSENRQREQTEIHKNRNNKHNNLYIGTQDDVIVDIAEDENDPLTYIPSSGKIPQADIENYADESELIPYDTDLDAINESVVFNHNKKQRSKAPDDVPIPTSFHMDDEPATLDNITQNDIVSSSYPENINPASDIHMPPANDHGDDTDNITNLPPLPYQRPPYTLLKFPDTNIKVQSESPDEKAKTLLSTLASFKINARIINISVGPVITRFELQPAQGVRVSSITALSNDIALSLAAEKVRIEAPIPGKAAIGIEVPNKTVRYVYLREIIESKEFREARSPLAFALGKDIAGKIITADLAKMPHLLIAGTTGSGKSVCLNAIILSLIYKSSPEDLRLILIDPKVVEFRMYAKLPHLLVPVVTDKRKAASALRWAVSEMERRYKELAARGVRDINRYNLLQTNPDDRMPKMVIIIDELAELMMTAAKEVEDSICRIAQLGRACGIHLIVATQRPSSDIITGLIKANISARIAFAVSDPINSRVILDSNGAEKLLGSGDMLYHASGTAKPMRIQCAFVSDDEVEAVSEFFDRTQTEPTFDDTADSQISAGVSVSASQNSDNEDESLFMEAVRVVVANKQASASMLQRRLRIGYNRASRLIEEMEHRGIVSGFDGSRPRKVLMSPEQLADMFGNNIPTDGFDVE